MRSSAPFCIALEACGPACTEVESLSTESTQSTHCPEKATRLASRHTLEAQTGDCFFSAVLRLTHKSMQQERGQLTHKAYLAKGCTIQEGHVEACQIDQA